MAASCSLQNASTTTRFLVGFTVLASILFALSPAVSSLPALSFAAAQVEAGVQTAFQSFDAHESSQEEAEQGNQFLERLRPKSAAARRTQDPEAGDGLIHEQGLTDDRTIVIKPRAGRGEQVKTTFQKSLRITRGQWFAALFWLFVSYAQLSAASALVPVFNGGSQFLLAYGGLQSRLAVIYAAVFGTLLALFFINALITTLGALVVLLLAEVSDDAGTKKRATARDAVKGKPSSVAEKKQATAAVSPTAVKQGDNN